MLRRSLIFILCVIGIPFGLEASHSEVARSPGSLSRLLTRVPLDVHGSDVRVEVMVNGQGPFLFGTDTGASQAALVSKALVERLRLPVVDAFRVSDGTGLNSRNADGARIDTITLGNLSFNQVLATVWGDGPKEAEDGEVYGTLGFDLFREYVVTYDYPGKELRIAKGRLPRPDGRTVLSYTLDRGTARVSIAIGRLRVDASIDTGSPVALMLPLPLADTLPLRTPLEHAGRIASILNEFDLYRAELDGDVYIGETTLRSPVILFSDLVRIPTIGREVLRKYVVSFDQRHLRVRIQPPLEDN